MRPYTPTSAGFPPEIIHEILKWFILHGRAPWQGKTLWVSIRAKTRVACSVCRSWRDVVLYHSVYWAKLSLQLCTKPSYTEFCVTNAKAGPIALELDLHRHEAPRNRTSAFVRGRCMTLSRFLSSTLPLLRGVYARVETLHIEAYDEMDIVAVMAVLTGYGAVGLRSITVLSCSVSAPNAAFVVEVAAAPLLRRMLTGFVRPLAFGVGIYKTVTELTVSSVQKASAVTKTELVAVLEACQLLEVLQLVKVTCVGTYGGSPIVLSRVRRFRMEYEEDDTTDVVACIRFPSLQELSLDVGPSAHIQALTRSSPSLFQHARHVSVYCGYACLASLLDVMLVARSAVSMDFRNTYFANDRWAEPADFTVALQSSKLETLRLPDGIPFNMFRIVGDAIASADPPSRMRLVTGGLVELGEVQPCEWDFEELSLVWNATAGSEVGVWMDPLDANRNK